MNLYNFFRIFLLTTAGRVWYNNSGYLDPLGGSRTSNEKKSGILIPPFAFVLLVSLVRAFTLFRIHLVASALELEILLKFLACLLVCSFIHFDFPFSLS
jgi:hypothetical protein